MKQKGKEGNENSTQKVLAMKMPDMKIPLH